MSVDQYKGNIGCVTLYPAEINTRTTLKSLISLNFIYPLILFIVLVGSIYFPFYNTVAFQDELSDCIAATNSPKFCESHTQIRKIFIMLISSIILVSVSIILLVFITFRLIENILVRHDIDIYNTESDKIEIS